MWQREHLSELDLSIWPCRACAKRCHAQLCHLPSLGAVLLGDFVQDFSVPRFHAEELSQQLPSPVWDLSAALFELPCLHSGVVGMVLLISKVCWLLI